jgi:hypothetical protein
MGQKGFFDVERRLEAISAKGDPLETIKKTVRWEDFRADNEAVTETKPEERKSNAGRKPYDAILKFKIVVLQSLHNLSDEQTEYRPHIVHALLRSGTRGPGAGCHHDLAVSPSVGGGRADRQAVRALRPAFSRPRATLRAKRPRGCPPGVFRIGSSPWHER